MLEYEGLITKHPLWEETRGCTGCYLRQYCQGPVPGDGPIYARLMLVGEAPGRNEDENGRPFSGAAGGELGVYLSYLRLGRGDVFVDNIVRCRPSGSDSDEDWKPDQEVIQACTGLWMEKTLRMVKPEVVLALGEVSIRYFVSNFTSVNEESGQVRWVDREWGGFWVVPSFHPAAGIYSPGLMRFVQESFQIAGELLRGEYQQVRDEHRGRERYAVYRKRKVH